MKRIASLCFILSLLMSEVCAQQKEQVENLTRTVVASSPVNEAVRYGEFQVELQKTTDYKGVSEAYWFHYLYTTRNKYTENSNIMINGSPLFVNRNMRVRTYRIGSSLTNSIFVFKNADKEASDIGYGMELVRAFGVPQPVCDSILDLNDDGFVFMQEGKCYYSPYSMLYDNVPQKEPVVWLERKVFDKQNLSLPADKAASFERLSKGDVYFESVYGHYYYLFRDKYMPYSVLVINNKVVELFDVYNEDNFKLKFSYNGAHWMAVGKECYWVDGVIKSIEGYAITDFVVTNDGHYGYKAYKKGASEKGEVVVADGQIVRQNARVNYFGLNAEGKLKFRFVSGGRTMQYENDVISDVTEDLVSIYYPDDVLNGRKHLVLSNNGKHQLTYQKGVEAVYVDGEKIAETIPCSAIYDERNHTFVWNAIEERVGVIELVIYRYVVKDGFLKKLFN